jgi:predicted ATPase with chaperone activity
VVGLPGAARRDASVRAALLSSGVDVPDQSVTVNLARVDSCKALGAELAIALALRVPTAHCPRVPDGVAVLGELGLDGAPPVAAHLAPSMPSRVPVRSA